MSTTPGVRELTVREAARAVDRAEETIRRWIWTGKLPAHRRGRAYRIDEDDLTAVVGAKVRASRPQRVDPEVSEWVARVQAWRSDNGIAARGGASQLVIEDRAVRSGVVDR